MSHSDRCAMPMGTEERSTFWPSPTDLGPQGEVRAGLLFVEFPDYRSSQPVTEIAGAMKTFVHDWYERSSFGQVDIRFENTADWVELPYSTGYYDYDYLQKPANTLMSMA